MESGDQNLVVTDDVPARYTRLLSVDAIRGIALLGMLLITVWEFGGFSLNQQAALQLQQKGSTYYLYALISALFEGKMRGLIALVFGAGIMLYMSRQKEETLAAAQELFIWRQLWLIIFGVGTAMILLWPGDILFHLGIAGLFIFPFFRMNKKGLLVCALIATVFYCGKIYWNYAEDKQALKKYKAVLRVENKKDSLAGSKNDSLTALQLRDKSTWEGIAKRERYDSSNAAEKMEKGAIVKGYGEVWSHLVERSKRQEAGWLYRTGIADLASLMLLGMALFRYGFFNSDTAKNRYLLFGILGIAAGMALSWLRMELLHEKVLNYEKYVSKYSFPATQFFPLERLLLSFGYLSFLSWFVRSNLLKPVWIVFSAVGRMAFTNYLLQTIICVFFFYGFGGGYFGHLSLFQLYFLVLEIWLIQIVFSVLWLRFYDYGPAEWLWRWLTIISEQH